MCPFGKGKKEREKLRMRKTNSKRTRECETDSERTRESKRLKIREWHQEGGRERETENTAASAQPLASLAGRLGCDGAHMPTCSNRVTPAPSRPVPPSSRRLKWHQGLEAFALLNDSCLLCPPPPTPHYQSSFQKYYSGYEGTIVFFFLFKMMAKPWRLAIAQPKPIIIPFKSIQRWKPKFSMRNFFFFFFFLWNRPGKVWQQECFVPCICFSSIRVNPLELSSLNTSLGKKECLWDREREKKKKKTKNTKFLCNWFQFLSSFL